MANYFPEGRWAINFVHRDGYLVDFNVYKNMLFGIYATEQEAYEAALKQVRDSYTRWLKQGSMFNMEKIERFSK